MSSFGNMVLDETLQILRDRRPLKNLSIARIHMSNYFTLIEISDGGVGACLSYYKLSTDTLLALEQFLISQAANDPLLLGPLFGPKNAQFSDICDTQQTYLVSCALRASLISALSGPCVMQDERVRVSDHYPRDLFESAQNALVIGFGGYLSTLLKTSGIAKVHVAELSYHERRLEIEAELDKYYAQFPGRQFTASDGHDTLEHLRDVDLISISGSTLGNGTLESILDGALPTAKVILQGQSANIHPMALFDRGVDCVATTMKPRILMDLASKDRSGKDLIPFFEGGLPWVYFYPRKG